MDDLVKRPAYDPNNLHPEDEEARKHDTKDEDFDWDEIIAATQDDHLAGIDAFDSYDYPDDETAMRALEAFVESVYDEVMREKGSPTPATDTARTP